jgi:hypothetical protein
VTYGIIASDSCLGENLLCEVKVGETEGFSADDHPIETAETMTWTIFHLDVIDEGTENAGSKMDT